MNEQIMTTDDVSGTIARRVLAFVIDYLILGVALLVAYFVVAVVGLLTFGVGWLLFLVLTPAIIGAYIAFSLGGPDQATPGMKLLNVHLKRDDGKPVDPLFAIVYAVLFWALVTVLTPFSLLIVLFTERKRTLHDILLGATVVRR